KKFVRSKVFGNPYIWVIAVANFFVYTVRYAVLDWGPTLLSEWKGISVAEAGWLVAAFEISGILGMLAAGWATDKFFGGRGPRVCVICMIMTAFFVFLLKHIQTDSLIVSALILGAAGFCIYGPQALVGIAAANMATKRAAATAVGFTGLFGYASTLASGWGLGLMAQQFGWDYAVGVIILTAVVGTVIFLFAWNAKANGYGENIVEEGEIALAEAKSPESY
ncbi:MAG: MFS transporter, partial [Bacteroidales bacterium]